MPKPGTRFSGSAPVMRCIPVAGINVLKRERLPQQRFFFLLHHFTAICYETTSNKTKK